MIFRGAIFFLGLLLVSGCQTFGPTQPVSLPPLLAPSFKACAPADGVLSVYVYKKNALSGSAELEWASRQNGSWEAAALNPIGQTLLRVVYQDRALKLSGRLAERLPKLAVLDDNFIEAGGYFTGIKTSELPCLLNFSLPASWSTLAYRVQENDKDHATVVHFADSARRMRVLAYKGAGGKLSHFCAEIKWSNFFGMWGSEVMWCQNLDSNGRPRASVKGLQDYSLRWTKLDDS